MAKKVFMIAPFEAMTGNLSGAQNLQYAKNNNPAYEAPNGTQYARNYKTRYVGARRGSDGLVYFSVRQRNAAVLNGSTRTVMGLVAITAAVKSAVKALPATSLGLVPWTHIGRCFEAYKEANPSAEDAKSVNTYFDTRVRRMLHYKQATYLFHESGVAGGWTLNNPYNLESADALEIKLSTWLKFANLFAFTAAAMRGAYFFIDGVKFFAILDSNEGDPVDFETLLGYANPNLKGTLADVDAQGTDDGIRYLGLQVYNEAGDAVTAAIGPNPDEKLTTIAPEP